MKRFEKFVITVIVAIFISLVIAVLSSCVSKHPKCAAYDEIEHEPMFKTNLERSLYK